MILTFNISDPRLFRLHYDVQNPLVIINHLLNILPETPLDKINLTLSEFQDPNLNEVHIFAPQFPDNISRIQWVGMHSDVNLLMWITYTTLTPLEIFDRFIVAQRVKQKFLTQSSALITRVLRYQGETNINKAIIQKAIASRHPNLFQKLPEDIINTINDFLKLGDMPKIKPDYCLPWQSRAQDLIESLDQPSEETITPDVTNQEHPGRRLRINNCCRIS
jgi:hypothetical protein